MDLLLGGKKDCGGGSGSDRDEKNKTRRIYIEWHQHGRTGDQIPTSNQSYVTFGASDDLGSQAASSTLSEDVLRRCGLAHMSRATRCQDSLESS